MNITYLIGNGFDIGLGLKTRYSDFLPKYVSRSNVTSGPVRWLMDQIRNAPQDTWADAEVAFGRLPFSDAGADIGQTIRIALDDFQKELASYLSNEERRFNIPRELRDDVRSRFLASMIQSLLLMSDSANKQEVHGMTAPYVVLRVNIISFNYTESISKLLGDCSLHRGLTKVNLKGRSQVDVMVNPICYVHGNLREKNSIFGVDSSCQLFDDAARRHCEHDGQLLKSDIDRLLGLGFEDQARQMILKSDRIVCFGLSFGETDLRWWECIYTSLLQNEKSKLILLPYFCSNRPCESGSAQLAIATDVRNEFLSPIRAANGSSVGDNISGLERVLPRMVVAKHYPHFDFDGKVNHCDPLNLRWFGQKYVRDFT